MTNRIQKNKVKKNFFIMISLLGLELEHIIIRKHDKSCVSYYDNDGQEVILNELYNANCLFFEKVCTVDNHLIGLNSRDYNISLEPGGQFEISIRPFEKISDIEKVYNSFLSLIETVFEKYNLAFEYTGYSNISSVDDVALIPKPRYQFMDSHFLKIGGCGRNMMRGSASTQVSVDFENDEDLIRKVRALYIIAPSLKLLSSNSPNFNGALTSHVLLRNYIWNNTEKCRTDFPHNLFSKSFTLDDYKKFYMSAPLFYKTNNKGEYIATDECAFDLKKDYGDFSKEDIGFFKSIVFPDIRIKDFIEIRVADSMNFTFVKSYLALIKGIVYNRDAVDYITDNFRVGFDDIKAAEDDIDEKAFGARIYGMEISSFITMLLNLAKKGLSDAERIYLRNFELLNDNKVRICEQKIYREEYKKIILMSDFDKAGVEYAQKTMKNGIAYFNGKPAAFSYIPFFLSKETRSRFKDVFEFFLVILSKCIKLYYTDDSFRTFFHYSDKVNYLLFMRGSPSSYVIPFSRIDFIFDEEKREIKIIEVNTDASSGMAEQKMSAEAVSASQVFGIFSKKYKASDDNNLFYEGWVEVLLNLFNKKKKNIHLCVIVSFDTQFPSLYELQSYDKIFKKHGIDFTISHIKNLQYEDGNLYSSSVFYGHKDKKIDLLWRFVTIRDMCEHFGEISSLLNALRDNVVPMYGDFWTQIAHDKELFAHFSNDEFLKKYFSKEERCFLKDHIPYTKILTCDDVSLKELTRHKNDYIIKPSNWYAGNNVTAGCKLSCDDFKRLVKKIFENDEETYLLQKYIKPSHFEVLPVYDMDEFPSLVIQNYNFVFSAYVINGKFAGIYLRSGKNSVIGNLTDEIVVPVFNVL